MGQGSYYRMQDCKCYILILKRGAKYIIVSFVSSSKVSVYKADENCESGEFTTSGECCSVCPPGEGVVSTCGEKDTECETCMDSKYTHTAMP